MTPTYKRNAGIIFMALGAGQLAYALFTGQMEGVDSLANLVTGLHDLPPTFANNPVIFLLGLCANVAFLTYGFKLFREGRRDSA